VIIEFIECVIPVTEISYSCLREFNESLLFPEVAESLDSQERDTCCSVSEEIKLIILVIRIRMVIETIAGLVTRTVTTESIRTSSTVMG
jgi:hypothetical protein